MISPLQEQKLQAGSSHVCFTPSTGRRLSVIAAVHEMNDLRSAGSKWIGEWQAPVLRAGSISLSFMSPVSQRDFVMNYAVHFLLSGRHIFF